MFWRAGGVAVGWGMGKRFRTDHLDQRLLLPPSLHDWLAEGHLARFVADVVKELDLGAVYRSHEGTGADWRLTSRR